MKEKLEKEKGKLEKEKREAGKRNWKLKK